jgi:hypothetical protein
MWKNSESLIKSFLHSNCFLLQYHKTRLIGERSTSNTVQMARTVHSHVIWTSPSCIASFVNMFRDHDLPSTTFHPSTLFSLTSLAVQHQKWAKIGSWHCHTPYNCCYECNREIRDLKGRALARCVMGSYDEMHKLGNQKEFMAIGVGIYFTALLN